MLALDSGHTIGDITGPDRVGRLYIERPVEQIRDRQVRLICLLIGMTRRLRTGQSKLFHSPARTISAQRYSCLSHHLGNASGTRGTIAGRMGFDHLLQQCLLFLVRRGIPATPYPVTATVHPEHLTQALHRIALFKPLYYRELLRESNIKRAVAFFRISFSSSTRRSLRFRS